MKNLTLGYSPCPNDTFIFYALVHGKIDTEGLSFRELLEDVETLNRMAQKSELDITKVSFHAFGHLQDNYCLLRSGGALGRGCGPLVIAKQECSMENLKGRKIAIPGSLTTAFLLLQLYEPELGRNVEVMPFHRIIDAVKNGDVDAGLIIHESRFTYQDAGLKSAIDLGQWWEEETGHPIPLGCIIAKRSLGQELVNKTERLIRRSLEYASGHKQQTSEYIKRYSQELDDRVIEQHIGLYVNDFSLDLGNEGISAVRELLGRAADRGIIGRSRMPLMFDQ